jgi:hypothetical protein
MSKFGREGEFAPGCPYPSDARYRIHSGDGRYIQHDQKIHRSVLKRLLYDQAVVDERVARPNNYEPYEAINAHIPPMVGAKRINYWAFSRGDGEDDGHPWDALMLLQNRNLEMWEGSSTPVAVGNAAEFRPDWAGAFRIPYLD